MKDLDAYLAATEIIDSDARSVISRVQEIKAGCLTDNPVELARKLFLFARDGVPFSRFVKVGTKDDFKASVTLQRNKGYCGQKGVLLAALARAGGIPSRIGLADIANHAVAPQMLKLLKTNIFKVHVFVEMYLDGDWVRATPAFDTATCNRVGWPIAQFGGKADGMLASELANGDRFIEYVKFYDTYADFPYDLVMTEMYGFYGEDTMGQWQKHAEKQGSREAVC